MMVAMLNHSLQVLISPTALGVLIILGSTVVFNTQM